VQYVQYPLDRCVVRASTVVAPVVALRASVQMLHLLQKQMKGTSSCDHPTRPSKWSHKLRRNHRPLSSMMHTVVWRHEVEAVLARDDFPALLMCAHHSCGCEGQSGFECAE